MHGLSVELRTLGNGASISANLAADIYKRSIYGKIAVVTDKPFGLLSATKKQWVKIIRECGRERSSTLNAAKIEALVQQVAWMQHLRFSARPPKDLLEAEVTFATADDFVRCPPICSAIYITYEFEREKLHMLTSWMPKNGVVIKYI